MLANSQPPRGREAGRGWEEKGCSTQEHANFPGPVKWGPTMLHVVEKLQFVFGASGRYDLAWLFVFPGFRQCQVGKITRLIPWPVFFNVGPFYGDKYQTTIGKILVRRRFI